MINYIHVHRRRLDVHRHSSGYETLLMDTHSDRGSDSTPPIVAFSQGLCNLKEFSVFFWFEFLLPTCRELTSDICVGSSPRSSDLIIHLMHDIVAHSFSGILDDNLPCHHGTATQDDHDKRQANAPVSTEWSYIRTKESCFGSCSPCLSSL